MHRARRIGMLAGLPYVYSMIDLMPVLDSQEFAQSGLFISSNQQSFSGTTSPAADQATNLFTFLAMRFSMSFGPAPGECFHYNSLSYVIDLPFLLHVGLGCTQLLNVDNPVTLTTDGNGVVTAATINTQELQQIFGGTVSKSTDITADG